MKATDLMIGDWVYEGISSKIKIKQNFGRSIRYDENGYSYEVEEACLNPIPLTSEILKNNGFYTYKSPNSSYCDAKLEIKIADNITIQISGYSHNNKWFLGIFKRKRLDNKGHDDSACLWASGLFCEYKEICVHELQHALRLCELGELANNFKV